MVVDEKIALQKFVSCWRKNHALTKPLTKALKSN